MKVASVSREKLKEGDRVGLGINCHTRCFFATINGQIVKEGITITLGWNEFYVGVGLINENEKVRVYFEPIDFKFNLPHLLKTIEHESMPCLTQSNRKSIERKCQIVRFTPSCTNT